VRIRVADNGCGIKAVEGRGPSLGVIGMQERSRMIGGELSIANAQTGGTVVDLRLPLSVNGHKNGRRIGQ